MPPDKPLTTVAYAAEPTTAYVEPVAVGEVLPEMPLFLGPGFYGVPLWNRRTPQPGRSAPKRSAPAVA